MFPATVFIPAFLDHWLPADGAASFRRYSGMDVAYVQFRAVFLGQYQQEIELLERSRLCRTGNQWFYFSGKLLEYDGPLL
jgi:uncharacterized protein YchJ